ncbi:coagulation factor 5/8 type domain-containing protein [Streptomyces abyssalis]|uniref:Coagulation factor 5/8 type domain-containing protein n=1 Tax=Streptomyces abyssalis TaxID=933944 RepID=A0A1E7JM57_9ACTN|nr:coagulation factor 5/8 type domain-containing protein [Streptomyces abyssalis]OEU89440.1 coagulation factor 5/8 type domain-containing protein [Streptomyces abyssalis]OEV07903.1 coagulation factor 5/8 type domain-containing protein [Streptomyces nanshensis]
MLATLAAAGLGGLGAATAPRAASAFGLSAGSGTSAAEPDFGPNVAVFGPETSAEDIQAKVDSVFKEQEEAQFGKARHAFLFKPGSYEVDVNVGFFTQVAGLGLTPGDVKVSGSVHAEADWFDGNATQNFWRSAEGISVTPSGGKDRWAVSQAAPYRRMHVKGDLELDDGGWSSGGLMADTVVDGQVRSGSQQQWLSRNTEWKSWEGSNWNMVFVGAKNAPSGGGFPSPPYTTVEATPKVREKPYLYVDGDGGYRVFVPALRQDATGASWSGGAPEGESLPLEDFHIAKAGDDSAATLNAALGDGKHLLLTPGVYELSEPLAVTKADTVVLGLGLATLMPTGGHAVLKVADVDGVKLAGFLVEAGKENSPTLVEVGPEGADADHASNPTSLHDVFIRIGGAGAAKSEISMVVNSSHVIADHLWLWRADHGDGVGWDTNPADTGLVVNGSDVTAYGLFAEHYKKYQVIWNGEGGRTYFFQNEMPYDPPDQGSWMNGDSRGYAAYKVGGSVTDHQAFGLGSYCFFNVNESVVADRSFEVPQAEGVKFHHMTSVSLGGTGTIQHVINDTGGPADAGSNVATVTAYP